MQKRPINANLAKICLDTLFGTFIGPIINRTENVLTENTAEPPNSPSRQIRLFPTHNNRTESTATYWGEGGGGGSKAIIASGWILALCASKSQQWRMGVGHDEGRGPGSGRGVRGYKVRRLGRGRRGGGVCGGWSRWRAREAACLPTMYTHVTQTQTEALSCLPPPSSLPLSVNCARSTLTGHEDSMYPGDWRWRRGA